ncbi:1-phosphatidylinositol 4,5-bisphosphate phosphodiesterase delta-4-like isoform X1 [Oncorhynchus nerka]|uniref:1-phosphatidylinositol 4,5-bisphosphate phosphodiesterase delta-4-like isoform X1 n=1 Tax=Oncorhynchus nerka TaxID=8023 RepID=UPI001131918B|nr:1-phosphatidylinositol 4,5-bisphosphate phosphodiesterase delta-4-like isoform X2 [Oncorhynchus nerka]
MESPQSLFAQGDEDLQVMKAGAMLRKVKSRSWKKQRHFRLQEDGQTIWYKSRWAGTGHSTFSVADVDVVREGHQSEILLSIADEFPADLCFTLVFRGRRSNLDLVAESPSEAQVWIRGVRKLIQNTKSMNDKERLDQWIWDWFQKADKNKDGRMNFKEVRTLLKMMNVDMNEEYALRLFTMADNSESGCLENEEFVQFYKMLTEREDVWRVFQDYSRDGQILTLAELEDFLKQEQQEGERSLEHAQELIDRYEPSENAKKHGAMSIDGFQMYLVSPEGAILDPQLLALHQDMSQPLSHYFICSSHNTYLMDDQLRGQSSQEAYIQALKRGCRCVEVDCWDGPNGEPVVYHGHTFTSKILFRDVITTLAEYAFKVSEFPVILSLENHCSMEQQRVMAQLLDTILGDTLLRAPLDRLVPQELPSPQDLKGKVLLKAKKIGGVEESETLTDEVTDEVSDEDEADPKSLSAEALRLNDKKSKFSRELSDLVVYCKSVHFHSFEYSRLHSKCYEMSSFSESKARKLAKDTGAEFVRHNSRQLSRVYPSGMRTDSSNYNPQELWNVGCQIGLVKHTVHICTCIACFLAGRKKEKVYCPKWQVALNFQTAGPEMDLNDGLFSQNGCCGYVLKPDFMRNDDSFDPERPQDRNGYTSLRLSIQVISGQQLPKVNHKEGSIVDPLVRVEIYGVFQDQAKQETSYIDNNGFNPLWNETLNFIVHVPELALVRFVVEDYDKSSRNDFMGQFTVPFTCIQPGYRHIHLLSKDGTAIPLSSLFVNIKISELTTEV